MAGEMQIPDDPRLQEAMFAPVQLAAVATLRRMVGDDRPMPGWPPDRPEYVFEQQRYVPQCGIMNRIFSVGPGMLKCYPYGPSRLNVATCLGKRLALDLEHLMDAQREGRRLARPLSWLWIVSPQRPQVALETWAGVPMSGWPTGFWHASMDERLCFVVVSELPETDDTLALRLMDRGPGLDRALAELEARPDTAPLTARLRAAVAAFQDVLQRYRK